MRNGILFQNGNGKPQGRDAWLKMINSCSRCRIEFAKKEELEQHNWETHFFGDRFSC